MEKKVLDIIDFIDSAVDKTDEFKDYSPEMSSRILDNRIITLEAYIKFIENETLPKFENLLEKFEEVNNG